MIRRLFWLSLGAAVGIAVYRRVTALVRTVSPGPRVRGLTRFLADVREGAAAYMERQPGATASTLDIHREHEQHPGPPAGRARYRTDHVKDGS